jgi:hypothetical protein
MGGLDDRIVRGGMTMKIKLNKSEHMDDWYTIVRAEHDGREWPEQVGPNCFSWMMSERLVPNACIEGDSYEMLAIAKDGAIVIVCGFLP